MHAKEETFTTTSDLVQMFNINLPGTPDSLMIAYIRAKLCSTALKRQRSKEQLPLLSRKILLHLISYPYIIIPGQ